MGYTAYLNSLMDEDLYEEREKLFEVLSEHYEDESVKNYDELSMVVFEFLLALEEEDDFPAIIRLKEIVAQHYPEVDEENYGSFAETLIPYYFSIHQEEEAKALFETWTQKKYDYDAILVTINRLGHYGKEAWLDDYIRREFNKIKASDEFLPGAETELAPYKTLIEVGKVSREAKTMEEALKELAEYEITLSETYQQIITGTDEITSFKQDQKNYLLKIGHNFQDYLYQRYEVSYLTSGLVMGSLIEYMENSKYRDIQTFFTLHEKSFEAYMDQNDINGLFINYESNFAMLYFLPQLYQFLGEEELFPVAEVKKEQKKVATLLENYKEVKPRGAWVLNELEMYQRVIAANNS